MPSKRPRRHGGAAAKQGLESDSGGDRRRGSSMRLFRHELRSQMRLYGRSRELAFFTFALTLIAFALEAVCMIAIGRIFFHTHVHNLFSLALALLLGAAAFTALGLALTVLIKSAEGSSAVVNAIYLPVSFLSGAFFSPHSFPAVLKAIANALPLVYMIRLVRDIAIHNQQIWNRPGDVAVIAAWGLAGAIFAARRFRWEPQEG